jgi:hypothetical protein
LALSRSWQRSGHSQSQKRLASPLRRPAGSFRQDVLTRPRPISDIGRQGDGTQSPAGGLKYVPWRYAMPSRIIALTVALMLSASTAAIAQSNSTDQSTSANPSGSVMQPQGTTGPINTKSTGGAPASSPQGETPPGMQAAPKGSDKTVRTDASGIPEGTPTK